MEFSPEVPDMTARIVLRMSVVVFLLYNAVTQKCPASGRFESSIIGWMLRGHVYDTLVAELPFTCVFKCREDNRCQSFNWVISLLTCEFNNRTKEARPEDFIPNSERSYYPRDLKRVPDPVAFFPLNAAYGSKEINNRAVKGIPRGVTLAPGPDGRPNYSYKFSESSNSYIEFPNSIGGPLDVRYSMTMLCWVSYDGKDGPLFSYEKSSTFGVNLWVANGWKLYVLFVKRDYSSGYELLHGSLVGGWNFVGASYDRSSGEAKLWVNGAVVQMLNIGAGLELATQDSIRMGVKTGDGRYFKGRIAQMRIYNRALTQEQIQAIQKLVVAA